MPFLEILLLALVQALTEFLPISSSAHLYLASKWSGFPYQGLTFDLALHLGTLLAVLLYFRKDWLSLAKAAQAYARAPCSYSNASADQRQLIGIVLASIPVSIVGFLIAQQDGLAESLRNDTLISVNLIAFGILLYAAERISSANRTIASLPLQLVLLIGLAQTLALMPGVSRSGITMTAALLLGLARIDAARFSFLLAVPATSAAVAKGALDMFAEHSPLAWIDFALGASLAALFGIVVIHFFLALLRRIGVLPFALYRIAIGAFLLLS
jgi:undecaprenyl-diphosphatase